MSGDVGDDQGDTMLLEMTAREPTVPGRERLRQLIAELSFKEGQFTLASGRKSNVFFNLKPTMLDPEGSNLLADQVIAKTEDYKADYIGGLAMGAVPVLVSVVLKSYNSAHPIRGFWVRKEQKHHGMEQLIDGNPVPGSRVIIVDDVTTTGGSVLKAVKAIEGGDYEIVCILTIIDRCEGAQENLGAAGYELISIFNRYDFTDKNPEDVE